MVTAPSVHPFFYRNSHMSRKRRKPDNATVKDGDRKRNVLKARHSKPTSGSQMEIPFDEYKEVKNG